MNLTFPTRANSAIFLVLLLAPVALAQSNSPQSSAAIDPQLRAFIQSIPAFDNHAHPVLPPPNDATDRNFDALAVDNMVPETDPVAWRPDNPELSAAWAALWGFHAAAPLDAKGMKALQAARARVKSREGLHYDDWVLDKAGIGVMNANRVAMGPGIEPPRFRWVPYADALLFPLDNSSLAAETPDREHFFPLEDKLRADYLHAVGLETIPSTLDEYLGKVVIPTLERQRAQGALAEKFEVAYLRSFDFSNPTRAQAAEVYAKWAAGGQPDPAAYKLLQDFLFRAIARECGRLGMAVHLHGMAGAGRYYNIAGSNPLLLESVLEDPALKDTNFVLLHGGWPFVREAGALLQKPNFYLDISQQSLTFPAHTLAGWLREWLETFPDKVLFGTDGYPFTDSLGWEESTWIAARNAREALGIALTGMMREGEIDRGRAQAIATEVLRANAEHLYAISQ
ncbi:MAG TPA: hypothetical protein VMU71_08905 [Terracidiphilus sp.]|nr:hypothetical protein [Terracidiphilus sp.]